MVITVFDPLHINCTIMFVELAWLYLFIFKNLFIPEDSLSFAEYAMNLNKTT